MPDISTTQSFADGDTVTAAKLNNIIAGASITSGAVTNAKLATDAVELDNMANNSVDTAELVNNAVQNSKLETMAAKTVKANATNATANPTDVAVAANKLLAGTSNSINAVSFTDDLELDASDSAATKIKAAATLIGGKSSVTADSSDELLIKDATDGALKRATAQSVVQSQVATTGTSGVVRVSSASKLIDVSSAITADVVGITTAAPMLAKAFVEFTSNSTNGAQTITNSFNLTSLTRTSAGVYDILFDTDLPSDKYVMIATAHYLNGGSDDYQLYGRITSKATPTGAGCTVKFGAYSDINALRDPDGLATLVFYGLTS
jgi:hypothetical protein|tara:strand:+ start:3736 stop:4698 length:963 start_codon:yes stop_codon:yes gene_type:complete